LKTGHIDFMADVGFKGAQAEERLTPLRFAVAIATRLNSLASSVDSVTVEIEDSEKLSRDVRRALSLGFGGKLCVHPRQLSAVHEAMRPPKKEVAAANKVLAASEAVAGAAVQMDGKMVDRPVVLRARQTLARASAADPSAALRT
jgi:citrate lyase subunit beta / citryl-CoA lyase